MSGERVCGSPSSFAVKWRVVSRVDRWVFGNFALMIGGREVGDYTDSATLKACRNWIADFVENPEDRFEPGLFEMDKVEAYRLLAPEHEPEPGLVEEVYGDTCSRFDVGHIGMSSMADSFVVLFMENEAGEGRFIWKAWADEVIHDACVPAGEVAAVFTQAVDEMTWSFGVAAEAYTRLSATEPVS